MELKYSSKSQAENGIDNETIMTPLRVKQSILANAKGGSEGGTGDYNDLENKPKINGVELSGNKTAQELGISGNIQADWDTSDPASGSYIKNKPYVPSKTSDLTNDSGYITTYTETDPVYLASAASTITTEDITSWNNKSDFSGSYTDLTDKPLIPTPVQSDWEQADTTSDDYIKNKPIVPTSTSDLINDSGYLTEEVDPVYSSSVAATIQEEDIAYWDAKQQRLVSGTNIKTINGTSLLGGGDIIIGEGGVMATDVEINGTSITSGASANIQVDGTYDPETNKLASEATVEEAKQEVLSQIEQIIDYIYYEEEQFTNPILGTTSLKGVVTVAKKANPVKIKISDEVTTIRLNDNDEVYIGADASGRVRIFANNASAAQSIRLGTFEWKVLSDGSVAFGGEE